MVRPIVIAASMLAIGQVSCAPQVALAPPELRARALQPIVPAQGRARLYVFRSDGGGRVLMPVAVDGVMLGSAPRNSFLVAEVAPGAHVVASATDENVSTVRLDTAAGESYYVQLSARMGLKATRTALQLVDASVGREVVGRSRLLQPVTP